MGAEGRPPPRPSPVYEYDDDDIEIAYGKRRCCCLWIPIPLSGDGSPPPASTTTDWWSRIGVGGGGDGAAVDGVSIWRDALMRIHEWSEILAGPRWKTFIRRFNRGGGGGRGGAPFSRFQYDPFSYALNFDAQSAASPDEGGAVLFRDFSARYAPPPAMRAAAAADREVAAGDGGGS